MTAMAPATSSQRKCRLPCFEIPPSLCLPPVECCLGTKPIHAARLRPDENVFQSPTSATNAVATIGPTPGISSSRRLSSLERCQAWMRFSIATISALTPLYWRASTSRLNRAAAGMRSSCSSAASAALPLDHVADSQRYERSSDKRSKSRRFRMPALANSILGLFVLALLFVFLYGPDKLVETV